MRILAGTLICAALVLASCEASYANSVYIVQSQATSQVYGDTVASEVKRLRPELGVRVLHTRGFNEDRFSVSKHITTSRIISRAQNYDNLILLGYDLLNYRLSDLEPIVFPLLVEGERSVGPASLVSQLEAGETVRRYVPFVGSTYYVLSDTSDLSQYRLRQLESRVEDDKSVDMEYFTIRKVTDLRRVLITINALNVRPGVILNNLFSVPDEDTMRSMTNDETSAVVADINTQHVEIGILRPDLGESIGVGVLARYVASAIVNAVESSNGHGQPVVLEEQLGVNLDRVSILGLNAFVLQNPSRISYVGANTYEH